MTTSLKAAASVCVALVLLASAASAQCPTSEADTLYFTTGANWTCAANFDCMTAYCGCVSGTLQSMTCTGYGSVVNDSTLLTCLAQRAVCTMNAALQSECSPELRNAYPALFGSMSRSENNVTTACVAGLCEELAAQSVAATTEDLRNNVCSLPGFSFPTPDGHGGGNGGGGDGLPQDPSCPNSTSSYFMNKPEDNQNCTALLMCETQWCNCNSFPLRSAHDCEFNVSALTQPVFEQCAPQFLRCMTNASVVMYNANAPNSSIQTCSSWASWLMHDYAEYYYSNNKAQTRIVQECSSLACNVEMYAFNHTGDIAALCSNAFAGLPQPAYNPNNGGGNGGGDSQCMQQGQQYFDKMPFGSCVTLAACAETLCKCVSGTYLGAGDCRFPTNAPLGLFQSCLATALSCIVNQALALYVPGTDATNPTVDVCVRWSVPIARDYKAYREASNKQATELFATCNRTSCGSLYEMSATANFAATCGFAAVTATPTFAEPSSCPFVCPDSTCARFLANCTCVANAAMYNVNSSFERALTGFDVTNDLNGLAYGMYRVLTGNCSSNDFNPYMRFRWVLSNSSNAAVYAVNGSGVRIPRLAMVPSATYTLTLTVSGLTASATSTMFWTITTVAPTPVVTITKAGAQMRVPNIIAVTLPATVVDPFPGTSPAFAWSCTALDVNPCPDMTNATILRLVIPANSQTGTFTIKFTYKSTYSSSMNLTIVAGAIPVVRIVEMSLPIVAVPALYLPTQSVNLATSVTGYNLSVTYAWTLNGVSIGDGNKTLSVAASSLTASTAQQLTDQTPEENIIEVRVVAVSDSTVFGKSTYIVVVAPTYTLTLDVKKSTDSTATSATGLLDDLKLTVASNIGTAPYGLAAKYVFLFTAEKARPLNTVPTNVATVFTAQAPMPFGTTTGAVSVTFGAQLQLGGKPVSSTTTTFDIILPDPAEAEASQVAKAAAITDSTAAGAAATNMLTMMKSSTDVAAKKRLAKAAVDMLANAMTDFSSQNSEQQASVFETLSTAVGSETDPTQLATMKAKTLTLMLNAVSSSSFDPANGQAALGALSTVSAKASRAVIGSLAVKMANDPNQRAGVVRNIVSGGVAIATVRQSASALGGMAVSDGSSSVSMDDGFSLPGVPEDAVVSIAQAAFSSNPFEADDIPNPDSSVVSIEFNVDGAAKEVSGLPTPLSLELSGASGSSSCKFWATTSSGWSATGVRSRTVNGKRTCQTDHLTAFASFSTSSSASVALSVLAALAVLIVQLLA